MVAVIRSFSTLLLLVCLIHCQHAETVQQATYGVVRTDFEIAIPVTGTLKASKATPIQIPPQIRSSQTISWLAEESSKVKAGDIIVRFDSTQYEIQTEEVQNQIAKLDITTRETDRDLSMQRTAIKGQAQIVEQEKDVAKKYSPKDLSIFSKSEIIDAAIDLDFLEAKETYYSWKGGKFEQKADAEMGLLEVKRSSVNMRLEQAQEALNVLEIKAPHDGVFVIEKNWRGEPVRVGDRVWGGFKIGKLPDTSNLEVQGFVLESEASGLAEGLRVELALDAHPGFSYSGTVNMVSPLAKPRERRSPIKYFEVTIQLDETNLNHMRLGNRVKGNIFVEKQTNVIAIPNQAVFQETRNGEGEAQGPEQAYWVYVLNGKRPERRSVEVGKRSITRTVISSGLQEGERVFLSKPEWEETN